MTRTYRIFLVVLMLTAVSMTAATGLAAAPTVSIEAASMEYFIGEMPHVKCRVVAGDTKLKVIRPERAIYRHAIRIEFFGTDGKKIRSSLGRFLPVKKDGDFQELAPGESVSYKIPLLTRIGRAGRYRIEVIFFPTADQTFVVRKSLTINARMLASTDVLARAIAPPANTNKKIRLLKRKIEILKLKTERGVELACFISGELRPTLTRFAKVDAGTDFTVTQELLGAGITSLEIWIVHNYKGKLTAIRLGLGKYVIKVITLDLRDKKKP